MRQSATKSNKKKLEKFNDYRTQKKGSRVCHTKKKRQKCGATQVVDDIV